MISKKIVFWVSFIGSLFFIIVCVISGQDFCYQNALCEKIFNTADFMSIYLILSPVVFLISLITYKMRDEVFVFWLKFAAFYLIPYIILVAYALFNSMNSGGSWAIPGAELIGLFFLFLLVLFFLISLILIIYKYFSLKKNTQNQVIAQK